MAQLTLERIEEMLGDGGYDCAIMGDEERHLQVHMGVDAAGQEALLDIAIRDDILGDPRLKKDPDGEMRLIKVEFQAVFGGSVDDLAMEQMSSLLHFINRMIDLPGFDLDELNGRVGYRYVHLTSDNPSDLALVRALVGSIKLFMDVFGPAIGEVGKGKKTFDDLLDGIVDYAKQLEAGDPA